jgi:hypothetical protein
MMALPRFSIITRLDDVELVEDGPSEAPVDVDCGHCGSIFVAEAPYGDYTCPCCWKVHHLAPIN